MSGTEYDAEHRRLRAALIANYEARGPRPAPTTTTPVVSTHAGGSNP